MNTPTSDIALSPVALVAARNATGMSQREAADAAGIARATLQFAEAGGRTPRLEHVAKLADVYGVTVDSLLTRNLLIPERAHAGNVHGVSAETPEDGADR